MPSGAGCTSPADLPLLKQVEQILADLLRSEYFGTAVELCCEVGDVVDVQLDRLGRKVAQLHLLDHALPERRHCGLLYELRLRRRGAAPMEPVMAWEYAKAGTKALKTTENASPITAPSRVRFTAPAEAIFDYAESARMEDRATLGSDLSAMRVTRRWRARATALALLFEHRWSPCDKSISVTTVIRPKPERSKKTLVLWHNL